jgi:hypothetical protein
MFCNYAETQSVGLVKIYRLRPGVVIVVLRKSSVILVFF